MSINTPPEPNVSTFNNLYWTSKDEAVTIEYADKNYLKFPIAQGNETLKNITVSGTANVTSGNNNSLLINTNPSVSQYNPCVTSTSQQVIAATGTINTETLILTTQSSNANGIVIDASSVNFPSTSAPTSSQTLLPANDNSNKIPTTAWIQSILATAGTVYTVRYTTNQTVITPTNCRSIDIVVMGAGGESGSTAVGPPVYYGGSGSGGNCISGYGIPMGEGESLDLTFSLTSTTGSTTVTRTAVILARAFNGNKGDDASIGSNVAGATVNSTIGIGDTSFGSWYNTFGSAGASSAGGNGTLPPVMTGGFGCPKGSATWTQGNSGMAQRIPSGAQGGGYVLITYHIGL